MKKAKALLLIPILTTLFSLSSCKKDKFEFKYTKIAVFADVQLVNTQASGAVQNCIPYLKNHLKLCKEQNVDVIVIDGDLVNQCSTGFYTQYETILDEIYGKDESKYPEFVYTMGNHEWYDDYENESNNAVSLFKKHARINTNALVKSSTAEIATQKGGIAADYYKVINGIPFFSVSGSSFSGTLSYEERTEIKGWLSEINSLPSIKKGGPIFVSYHYPIMDLTYSFGQGANEQSTIFDEILKDYPNVVLFSGDTHFAGGNERTINQVNYTNINLGSSCYSRHVSHSALMDKYVDYYNISGGNSGKDLITGDVATNYNKTPHIQIVEVDDKGNTTFNRYFSTDNPAEPKHIGLEWNISCGINKENFEYTNHRFANKEWANKMYQADGLSWTNEATASYSKNSDDLIIEFPDVTNFNWCEHYKVKITADTTKEYDFISHYYKWEEDSHTYSEKIIKRDLPAGEIQSITVEAYDCLDNQSLNFLTANSK